MSTPGCRRLLNTNKLAEDFIKKTLCTKMSCKNIDKIAEDIVNAEIGLAELEKSPTSTHDDYRSNKYRDPQKREELRETILYELIYSGQLKSDDDIRLSRGGAKPREVKSDMCAYIVSGPPASGKSAIASKLAAQNGAYMLDSDYAKRKFPEYKSYTGGASLVHKESDEIVFGSENSLFEYCIYSRHNVVIPLVGRTYKSVEQICERLIGAGYNIHIINVVLDRYECVVRAYNRYKKTKRYVPLSYIFDEVGNEPERVYFLLKRKYCGASGFASFSQVSTDVKPGENAKLIEATEYSPLKE